MSTAEAKQARAWVRIAPSPRPDPDDPRKPDSPGPQQAFVEVRRPQDLREFTDDQCTDLAAALTYYAVLAIFPACSRWCPCSGWSGRRQSIETLDRRTS